MATSTTPVRPSGPMYCSHHPHTASAIHSADGRLVAMVAPLRGESPTQQAELFALAPESMRALVELVHAVCGFDPATPARFEAQPPNLEKLAIAIADTIAVIRHAHKRGVILPEVTQ